MSSPSASSLAKGGGGSSTFVVLHYFIHGKRENPNCLDLESSLNAVTELLGRSMIARHDLLFLLQNQGLAEMPSGYWARV